MNNDSYHGYEIGDIVYVKPRDYKVLKGTVIGFQKIGNHLPIVESEIKGEKFSNAYDLSHISKTETVTIHEWRLVPIEYKYQVQ